MNCNNLAKPQEERWEELFSSLSGEQLHFSGKEAQFTLVNNVLIPLGKRGFGQILGRKVSLRQDDSKTRTKPSAEDQK